MGLDASSEKVQRPRLPTAALDAFDTASSQAAVVSPVAARDCETPASKMCVDTRSCSFHGPDASALVHALPAFHPAAMRSNSKPLLAQSAGLPIAAAGMKQTFSYQSAPRCRSPVASPVLLGRSIRNPVSLKAIAEVGTSARRIAHAS